MVCSKTLMQSGTKHAHGIRIKGDEAWLSCIELWLSTQPIWLKAQIYLGIKQVTEWSSV